MIAVAGSGPDLVYLKDLVKTLQMEKFVTFLGYVEETMLPSYYRESYFVAYPVAFERFGLVPLEAMACGKPVVACTPGGPSETVVHNHTGILVDYQDADGFVDALDMLLSNPEKVNLMGQNARKHVEKSFSWKQTCLQLTAELEKLGGS
jgi:glycosyltransferase involved in cell wall biosynthesis